MNPSVLIVDDSLTVRMDLQSAFDAANYSSTLAATLEEAGGALGAKHFDLIVLDVLLPDGDGVDFLGELKEAPETSSIPVIMLTVEANVQARIRGLETGAQEYVGKPYAVDYLLSRANELVDARRKENLDGESSGRLLVIDDSATYREQFKEIVEPMGYHVVQAPSGEEGLRLAAQTTPLAIVVDGIMPGLDGLTVVRRIRADEVLREVPCLFITGADDEAAELNALEAGADAFARKDEDAALLVARLEALIRPRLDFPARAGGETRLFGAKRLLVISGDSAYASALREHLLPERYEVAVVEDVMQGLELLNLQRVDCIFIEAALADRVFFERIKQIPASRAIPLIILTDDPSATVVHSAFASGADDFVLKSSDFSVTKARVRNWLHRKQIEEINQKVREERLILEGRAAEASAMKRLAELRASTVAELERKNEELTEARTAALAASQAKSEFVARISHEIRTPLHSVVGTAELLQRTTLNSEQRDLLGTVLDSAGLLLKIVNDVLDFSKLQAGKIEFDRIDFDLTNLLESTLESFAAQAHAKRIELVLTTAHDLPKLLCGDPARTRQVLTNLIGNAVKFTDHGEVVANVVTEERAADRVRLRFEIRDTGIGIAKPAQANLFQAFSQATGPQQYGGTGLGLAIAAKLVEGMQGNIGLESEPGKGSTFYFSLPFENAHTVPATRPPELRGVRAIVVDDNSTSRAAVGAILEAAGMQVETADEESALAEIGRAAGENRPFQVAVIDQEMPISSGVVLASALNGDLRLEATRVVLMTSATDENGGLLGSGGIDARVTKPVRAQRLLETLSETLGLGKRQPQANAPAAQTHASDQGPPSADGAARIRVLVVEDNPMNQKLARMQLRSLGYGADVASSGPEAIEALSAHHYPIVLMDCGMPGMDGYTAAREIRRVEAGGRRAVIIAMTAHTVEGARERCLAAGMDDYIAKPVTIEMLSSVLSRWTAGTDSRAGAQPSITAFSLDEDRVDMNMISELRKLCSESESSALSDIIGIFLQDLPKMAGAIESALDGERLDELARAAHALRGASSCIGAVRLASLCTSLKAAGRSGKPDEARTWCGRLREELPRTRASLEQICRNQESSPD